jgi:hypothetical protein
MFMWVRSHYTHLCGPPVTDRQFCSQPEHRIRLVPTSFVDSLFHGGIGSIPHTLFFFFSFCGIEPTVCA